MLLLGICLLESQDNYTETEVQYKTVKCKKIQKNKKIVPRIFRFLSETQPKLCC